MRRQFAAWIAVVGLIVAGCTSSAEAGDELPTVPVAAAVNPEEAAAARIIENFFRSLQQRDAYALYALFVQDSECHSADIAAGLEGMTTSISPLSDVEVTDITLRQIGETTAAGFDLVEIQGTSEKLVTFEEFFPLTNDGGRWKLDANICEWLTGPDVEIQSEMQLALAALEEFRTDTGTYLAGENDLRYYASGLKLVTDEMTLTPGTVLLTPGVDQALLVGQGTGGGWYCIAVADDAPPLYSSAPTFEEASLWETCTDQATTGGW